MNSTGIAEGSAIDIHSEGAAKVALKAFFRIADAWGLDTEEQMMLLGGQTSTYRQWRDGHISEGLPTETLERISLVLNIYAALHTLLPDAALADAWPRRPNSAPLFGGGDALAKMLSGTLNDLRSVALYLQSHVSGTCT